MLCLSTSGDLTPELCGPIKMDHIVTQSTTFGLVWNLAWTIFEWMLNYFCVNDQTSICHSKQRRTLRKRQNARVLFKVRHFSSATLRCQRSSEAVDYLMTWLPQATAGSLIYTCGQRWMIHSPRKQHQDMWQGFLLFYTLWFTDTHLSINSLQ